MGHVNAACRAARGGAVPRRALGTVVSGTSPSGAPSPSTPGSSVPTPPEASRDSPGTSSTGTRTRRSTSSPCPRARRASSSRPGTSTGRCASCPTAASSAATTPRFRASTTSVAPSPTSSPPTARSSTSPTARSAARPSTCRARTRCRAQSIGSDSPPTANGVFNNNQTYTGCAVDSHHNVFGNDIATAQGDYPPPSSGRLVEWFAPNYTTYCIVYGPDAGGVRAAPHRRDRRAGPAGDHGAGGQRRPARPQRRHLQRAALRRMPRSRPARPSVPGGVYPRAKVQVSTFVKVVLSRRHRQGPDVRLLRRQQLHRRPVHRLGECQRPTRTRAGLGARDDDRRLGKSPDQYNPFGMAFAPDGTLYFVDIHIACTGLLTGCGPADYGGRVMRVTFTNGQPSAPVTVAGGFDFPTSVTVCVPAQTRCPYPTRQDQGAAVGTVGEPRPGQGSRRRTPRPPPASAEPALRGARRPGRRRATGH